MGESQVNQIEIYQSESGVTSVEIQLVDESFWMTQSQMADLFEVKPQNITMHLKNIFNDGELAEKSTCKDFLQVQFEGEREVRRKRKHYNLDAVISVGYRVNSSKATKFRIWATQRLKELLVQGYTLNQQRFEKNAKELQQALKLIEKTARSPELTLDTGRGLTEIVSRYTQTFMWLQRYDEGLVDEPSGETGGQLISNDQAQELLNELKLSLIEKGEATELFAKPRAEGLAGIFGNLEQSVFGDPAYPSIESKAAHLLYFVVKNHPFADGNKRSEAFLFVDFLNRNKRLLNDAGEPIINDTGLAALTLLVAESDPKQKGTLIRLIMHMVKGT